jgi:hypothetical protein
MTRRERLLATLRGAAVDRPAVSFYEIGMFRYDADDPDAYNVHNDPSWRPLLELARQHTDIMQAFYPPALPAVAAARDEFFLTETWEEGARRCYRTTVKIGGRTLTEVGRRDAEVDTNWTVEHLLKDADDVRAFLELPDAALAWQGDGSGIAAADAQLGDAGIVILDVADPLCRAASLFSLGDYTVLALTEGKLFHALLEKFARAVYPGVESLCRQAPGRMWRIVGSEYASEPYLPPWLYAQYEARYTAPIVRMVHASGGFARIHSHGRLRNILPHIAAMGADGLDPVEPPPQGDMALIDVRRRVGRQMVLFGNIEIADVENLRPDQFEVKVARALREGTDGEGRGFVLLPSACPYGRTITPTTLANYQTMVRLAANWRG